MLYYNCYVLLILMDWEMEDRKRKKEWHSRKKKKKDQKGGGEMKKQKVYQFLLTKVNLC